MKKQYISPKSEVINIECNSPLLNTSPGAEDGRALLEGDTETDEQW